MRISQAQPNEVETLDDYDKIEYGVDLEDMGMMYQAFLNYSDPVSTIVREITSNCFDSHIEAGVDKNIEIEIKNKNYLTGQSASIHFRDFGVGLSPERIKTVYSKFFKSTKRDTDNEIGGFGLGAKSPLSYVDMFTVVTWYDNIRYDYIVHKGSKSPAIELLSKTEETRENGTEVIVTIKDYEEYNFKKAIKTQLQFFDKITFINCEYTPPEIKRFKNFVYTSDEGGRNLHIVMGKVVYPVKSDVVESIMNDLNYSHSYRTQYDNFYLYFDIGDLDLVWTREALNYSPKTIKAISEKLKAAKEEIIDLVEKNTMTFKDALQVKNNTFKITINGQSLQINKENYLFSDIKYSDLVADKYQQFAIDTTEIPVLKAHYRYYQNGAKPLSFGVSKSEIFKYSTENNIYLILNKNINSEIKDYLVYEKGNIYTCRLIPFDSFIVNEKIRIAKALGIEAQDGNGSKRIYTEKEQIEIKDFGKKLYNHYVDAVKSILNIFEDQTPTEEFLKQKAEERERLKNISSWNFTKYSYRWRVNVRGHRCKFNYDDRLPFDENLEKFRNTVNGQYSSDCLKTIVIYDNQKHKDRVVTVAKEYIKYSNLNFIGFTCNKDLADLLEKHDNHQFVRASNANDFYFTKRIEKNKQRGIDIKTINNHLPSLPGWLETRLPIPYSLNKCVSVALITDDLEGALKREPEFALNYFKQLGIAERYNYLEFIRLPYSEYVQNDETKKLLGLLEKPKHRNASDYLVGKFAHKKLQQQKEKDNENISTEEQQCTDSDSRE